MDMGIDSLVIVLLIGAVGGWLAGTIMDGRGVGLIGNILVGIIGAFVAGLIFPMLGFSIATGILGSIIHATIGAIVVLFVVGLVKRA